MKVNFAEDFQGLFGPHSAEESAQLEESMLADISVIPPCALWANAPKPNTMIEGHERYRISQKHGLKIKFVKLSFDTRDEALDYARKAQLGRRNLTGSQAAMLVAELNKRRKPAGKPSGNVANLQGLDSLAKKAGTSARTMSSAAKVAKHGARKVIEAVKSGDVAVSDAAAVADKPKAEQAAALKKLNNGEAPTLKAAINFNPPPPGNSLESVQADLREFEKRCYDLARFGRTILGCKANDITRAYCSCYSVLTVIQPLTHVARCINNDMPVGGTPAKPILFHEQKAAEIGKGQR